MSDYLQMKSLHSSNSQHSSPENQIEQELIQTYPSQSFEHKDQKKEPVETNFAQEENKIQNQVIKEKCSQCFPMKQNNESKDVNLLQDCESSKQLECVISSKIYLPEHKIKEELLIIQGQRQENKLIFENKQNDKAEVEKVQSSQKQNNSILHQNIGKQKKSFFIACQRVNPKPAQKKQAKTNKKVDHPKKQKSKMSQDLKFNFQFEQYFQQCKFDFCGKFCQGGNFIQMVCVQKNCNSQAEHCLDQQCNFCNNKHKNCQLKFKYKMFIKSLQRNVLRQKKTMQIVYEAYSNILTEIKKNREKTMKFLCVQGVNESLMDKLEQRYKIRNHISFIGKEVLKVLQQLSNQSENNLHREIRIQQKMREDQKEIMTKLNQQMHLLFEPYSACSLNILNSRLLSNKNDIKFVLEQLNYPRDMKLLYRASQHEFSISKFHEICDNQENTFTIIKTEFGKFIGGFTPIKWNSKYGRDRTNKTFLLAINLKEKLQHINHGESAIYYDERLGPSFGGLFETKDIQIFEQNGLLCCKTNFPNTFNWKKFFTSTQESWKFLTGVQAGRKCRVMDYEVFKVYFRSEQKQ